VQQQQQQQLSLFADATQRLRVEDLIHVDVTLVKMLLEKKFGEV